MNSSKINETLKSINDSIATNANSLTTIISNNETRNDTLRDIKDNTGDTDSTLNSIDTLIYDMNATVSNIASDVSDLNRKKIIFNARLTDGTNPYLLKADYSSTPIDFYWQNDKNTQVYINKYRFIYTESTEPTPDQLYHSTAWSSNIGAMNSAGTDYETPYVTVEDNKDYLRHGNSNGGKAQWVSNNSFVFEYPFEEAPIEIGVSRKFGHHINADINTGLYDSNPIGIVEGYYYS